VVGRRTAVITLVAAQVIDATEDPGGDHDYFDLAHREGRPFYLWTWGWRGIEKLGPYEDQGNTQNLHWGDRVEDHWRGRYDVATQTATVIPSEAEYGLAPPELLLEDLHRSFPGVRRIIHY
jgi:hypothetical protein